MGQWLSMVFMPCHMSRKTLQQPAVAKTPPASPPGGAMATHVSVDGAEQGRNYGTIFVCCDLLDACCLHQTLIYALLAQPLPRASHFSSGAMS
jgi:hypothetical protein